VRTPHATLERSRTILNAGTTRELLVKKTILLFGLPAGARIAALKDDAGAGRASTDCWHSPVASTPQSENSMRKIVLTYGLIAGGILAATFLIALGFHDAIGFERGLVVGYTSMVLAFLLIFFGVRSYRDNVAGGRVGFGRALAVGVLIGVVASCCYVLTWEVLYFGMKSDYIEKYQAHMIEKAQKAGESPEAIAAKQAEMANFAQMYRNPLINSAMTFMEPMPVALVMALISAGVLSRRKKAETERATA
jgi:hypothetical protein